MEGYAKLASLMGNYSEAAILRRFGALRAQNLLYLQAELVHLERQLLECSDLNERSDDPERVAFSKDWFSLAHFDTGNHEQWQIMLRIREKLKEYGDALLQQTMLQELQQPNARDLKFLQHWMKRPSMGSVYLLGLDSDIWEKPDLPDLISLGPGRSESIVSAWLTNSFVHQYHQILGRYLRKPGTPDYLANTVHYSQEGLRRTVSIISMCISSLLPIAAITVLYFVNSMLGRLAFIASFTVIFTLCLALLTNARPIEVFAATTAFAAVQVVYVSANGSTA